MRELYALNAASVFVVTGPDCGVRSLNFTLLVATTLRDWFLYHFVSGHAFWSGLGLIVVAWLIGNPQRERETAIPLPRRSRLVRRCRSWCLVLGLSGIVLSGTPLPVWLALLSAMVLIVWWWWCDRSPVTTSEVTSNTRVRIVRGLVPLSCVVCAAFEAPYHIASRISVASSVEWSVIGDSLSAEFDEGPPWPRHLARNDQLTIHNLAVAGATAKSAFAQLETLQAGSFVIVEIGGNDLLGETSADQYEEDLDRLLKELRSRHHDVAMFELPVPPWAHRFGAIQRCLAHRHAVTLIPKRILAGVLTTPGATNDGLHFAQLGHGKLAQAISALRR